jgi:hypothetical protein
VRLAAVVADRNIVAREENAERIVHRIGSKRRVGERTIAMSLMLPIFSISRTPG